MQDVYEQSNHNIKNAKRNIRRQCLCYHLKRPKPIKRRKANSRRRQTQTTMSEKFAGKCWKLDHSLIKHGCRWRSGSFPIHIRLNLRPVRHWSEPSPIRSMLFTNCWIDYSSFREYLDCSEDVTRRTCGAETGTFIRGFLKKMSSTLEKDYCEEYYKQGVNQCPNIFSSASSLLSTPTVVKAFLLSLVLVMFNLR